MVFVRRIFGLLGRGEGRGDGSGSKEVGNRGNERPVQDFQRRGGSTMKPAIGEKTSKAREGLKGSEENNNVKVLGCARGTGKEEGRGVRGKAERAQASESLVTAKGSRLISSERKALKPSHIKGGKSEVRRQQKNASRKRES